MPSNLHPPFKSLLRTNHRLLLDANIPVLLKNISGRALVIGAGHVNYALYMPNASKVVHTDINSTVDERLINADAHNLQFADESFDVVLAFEVLEHLHNPILAVSEIWRILSPRGQFIGSIPFAFRIHGDPCDYQRFTRYGLETLFSNFNTCHVINYGNRIHVILDLITTSGSLLVLLRIFNHILIRFSFLNNASYDCPSGYFVIASRV